VLQRDNPAPRTGRVSWSEPDIAADHDSAASESVRFNGSGAVVFARLAWPGYSAQLNGAEIPVERGPAGLLRVNVPPDVESGQLRITWTPPGMQVGLACAAVGALGALVLGLVQARNRANKAGMWS
jgi:uncharacterized membrane protein YfhO